VQILKAALNLFSRVGYHGASMRDIALGAKVSTGNVYHQFPDKETIFQTLLEEYWETLARPDLPFNKALAEGAFPDDLEKLARAVRATVDQNRKYVALIYVDVVEFDGSHIRRFYSDMASRFQAFLEANRDQLPPDRLREGVPPLTAVLMAIRFFFHYYSVELLFGVPNHFGVSDETALEQIVDILKHGMFKPGAK
jgi:AcrR family transcriptional regulator